jgi:hypothetical protein
MTVVMVVKGMQMWMSVMVLSVNGMHMQRVQVRMSVVMLQMWVYMHFLIYPEAYAGHFDADLAVAGGWATVYADELLCT